MENFKLNADAPAFVPSFLQQPVCDNQEDEIDEIDSKNESKSLNSSSQNDVAASNNVQSNQSTILPKPESNNLNIQNNNLFPNQHQQPQQVGMLPQQFSNLNLAQQQQNLYAAQNFYQQSLMAQQQQRNFRGRQFNSQFMNQPPLPYQQAYGAYSLQQPPFVGGNAMMRGRGNFGGQNMSNLNFNRFNNNFSGQPGNFSSDGQRIIQQQLATSNINAPSSQSTVIESVSQKTTSINTNTSEKQQQQEQEQQIPAITKLNEENESNTTPQKTESPLEPEQQPEPEPQFIRPPPPDIKFHDDREHLNIVFIGHVDAGKSTLSGQILISTGQADERTVAKYKEMARTLNRESQQIAYIMDTSEEERSKGKTVEVGRAQFETEKKRFTILDAPGHKNYVPAMINGAAQADVAVLVISTRRGEFEAGFQRGGQTREHTMLVKTLGITKLIVAVNKMDDETVQQSKERYDFILSKLQPYLKKNGFREKDIIFLPLSALTGDGLKTRISSKVCPQYNGKSLLETLDQLKPFKRDSNAPVRVPIIDCWKDMGVVVVLGKVESGILANNSRLLLMPSAQQVDVVSVQLESLEVNGARPGENVNLFIKGCDVSNVHSGDVLCSPQHPAPAVTWFDCQLKLIDLLEHKPLMSAGYKCILHIHTISIECEIIKLIALVGKGSKRVASPTFVRSGSTVECRISVPTQISIERYSDFPQLGRFTLRDEGKTIAIGKVLEVKQQRLQASTLSSNASASNSTNSIQTIVNNDITKTAPSSIETTSVLNTDSENKNEVGETSLAPNADE